MNSLTGIITQTHDAVPVTLRAGHEFLLVTDVNTQLPALQINDQVLFMKTDSAVIVLERLVPPDQHEPKAYLHSSAKENIALHFDKSALFVHKHKGIQFSCDEQSQLNLNPQGQCLMQAQNLNLQAKTKTLSLSAPDITIQSIKGV